MTRRFTTFFVWINVVVDYLLLNFLLFICLLLVNPYNSKLDIYHIRLIIVLFNLSWFYCSHIFNIYNNIIRLNAVPILTANFASLGLFAILLINIKFILPSLHIYASPLLLYLLAFSISIITWRILYLYIRKHRRKFWFNPKNVVIVGIGPAGVDLYNILVSNPQLEQNVLGFFDDCSSSISVSSKGTILGKVNECIAFAKQNNVHEIYCTLPNAEHNEIAKLMQQADQNLIRFRLVPDVRGSFEHKLKVELFDYMPVLIPRQEPLDNVSNEIVKRAFDILFSALVITFILSWLTPLLAIIIKLDSKGPVFFKQLRSGKDNKPFYCLKFRSMAPNNECDSLQASKDDLRVTRIGKFIRKTSIDELPQFINVFMGHMSVVGPRPHMLKHTQDYSLLIDNYMVRHFITPGITGWAQVNGFRGETKETSAMLNRVQADLWYLENWTILLDLKIVALTVLQLFRNNENAL